MNGCGELTGMAWVDESGIATGPYMITGTGSVGLVHDALLMWSHQPGRDVGLPGGGLPIVGETYDGRLSAGLHDGAVQPVTEAHVFEALDTASTAKVVEGAVGGGTGMVTHGFKGGIGSSSRVVGMGRHGKFTVGVLVQSNYGTRDQLRIAGVPVGEELSEYSPPAPPEGPGGVAHAQGSIIVYVGTDAPLLPHQLKRLAKRPALALGRMGSVASDGSGDIFFAFSTANPQVGEARKWPLPLSLLSQASKEAAAQRRAAGRCGRCRTRSSTPSSGPSRMRPRRPS